jgi:hypothetical protein
MSTELSLVGTDWRALSNPYLPCWGQSFCINGKGRPEEGTWFCRTKFCDWKLPAKILQENKSIKFTLASSAEICAAAFAQFARPLNAIPPMQCRYRSHSLSGSSSSVARTDSP